MFQNKITTTNYLLSWNFLKLISIEFWKLSFVILIGIVTTINLWPYHRFSRIYFFQSTHIMKIRYVHGQPAFKHEISIVSQPIFVKPNSFSTEDENVSILLLEKMKLKPIKRNLQLFVCIQNIYKNVLWFINSMMNEDMPGWFIIEWFVKSCWERSIILRDDIFRMMLLANTNKSDVSCLQCRKPLKSL